MARLSIHDLGREGAIRVHSWRASARPAKGVLAPGTRNREHSGTSGRELKPFAPEMRISLPETEPSRALHMPV